MNKPQRRVFITGASSGIGAVYAERFARRGHDLTLVARDSARLNDIASHIRAQSGCRCDIRTMVADLTVKEELARVEESLARDSDVGILVNNAGSAHRGSFANSVIEEVDSVLNLNMVAVVRLTAAALPNLLRSNDGAVINISSLAALSPEMPTGVYSATKAFVLILSQSLHAELGTKGLYVQVVLPGPTRTDIWRRSGRSTDFIRAISEVGEVVDAALAGFDRRELITIPTLPDVNLWTELEATRANLLQSVYANKISHRYGNCLNRPGIGGGSNS